MAITLYDTRTLLRVIEEVAEPNKFVLDRFFPYIQLFDTEYIDFDVIRGGRKLAPFVSPSVAGRPQTARGLKTKTFKPAYTKAKTPVDPNRPFRRRAGERYGGDLSADQRRNAVVTEIMVDHYQQIIRRKVWMAWQALRTGRVVVSGEDYPEQVVDFERDSSLTKVLAGAARWGQPDVSPVRDLELWGNEVSVKSFGATPNAAVMGIDAWQEFEKDPKVAMILDSRRGSASQAELGPTPVDGYILKGVFGSMEVWVSTDSYEDDAGQNQDMLGKTEVVLGSPLIEGVQAHGAIRDPRAGYQAVEVYPKNWIEEDPAEEYVMTQSAPLVVPTRVDASACITVK